MERDKLNIILFDDIPSFISLSDSRGRHIKKILKAVAGDCLKAGVVNGARGEVCIESVEADGYRVSWRETGPAVGLYPLTLLVGFVRPISVKRILREAASLGVGRLVFTVTDTGERSYREANLWKTGEYREYLINGVQTAGATVLPEVVLTGGVREAVVEIGGRGWLPGADPTHDLGTVRTDQPPARIVLDNVEEGRALSQVDLSGREVVLAVGSERGWSDRERQIFREAGFESVSLGSRVLRTETACSTGTAIALARVGFV